MQAHCPQSTTCMSLFFYAQLGKLLLVSRCFTDTVDDFFQNTCTENGLYCTLSASSPANTAAVAELLRHYIQNNVTIYNNCCVAKSKYYYNTRQAWRVSIACVRMCCGITNDGFIRWGRDAHCIVGVLGRLTTRHGSVITCKGVGRSLSVVSQKSRSTIGGAGM